MQRACTKQTDITISIGACVDTGFSQLVWEFISGIAIATLIQRISKPQNELNRHFLSGCKGRKSLQIGMEVEHLCINERDGSRIPYDGSDASVESVLRSLVRKIDGQPVFENDKIVGINSTSGNVTLEPGGQIEWSSPPCENLETLGKELKRWLNKFRRVLNRQNVATLDAGLDVGTAVDEIPWIPKHRYRLMRQYYSRCPEVSFAAMGNTASVHVALDYRNELDWQRKFRAMLLLTPVVISVFGNSPSPIRDANHQAWRQALWSMIDPARCEPPEVAFNPAFRLSDWVAWVARAPELFHRADEHIQLGTDAPFETNQFRNWKDLELHLSSIFTPVRTDTYLEVRTVDIQQDSDLMAAPAFWYGLLYSKKSLNRLLHSLSFIQNRTAWKRLNVLACRFGLRHDMLKSLSTQVTQLALDGLEELSGEHSEAGDCLARFVSNAFRDAEVTGSPISADDLPRTRLAGYFDELRDSGL